MPVTKCSNGKYRIGKGKCEYKSKSSADRAYAGYRAHEHMDESEDLEKMGPADSIRLDVPLFIRILELARETLKTDIQVHDVAEACERLSNEHGQLSMDNYQDILAAVDELGDGDGDEGPNPTFNDHDGDEMVDDDLRDLDEGIRLMLSRRR